MSNVNMVAKQVRDHSRFMTLEFLTSNPGLALVILLACTVITWYSLGRKGGDNKINI